MMSEAESKDLELVHKEQYRLLCGLVSSLKEISRSSDEALRVQGYRTVGEAMVGTHGYYQKIIDRLWNAHFTKWKD